MEAGRRLRRRPAGHTGGDDGDRTHDLRLAKPALSQLSYVPKRRVINAPAATRLTLGRLLAKKWWARQGSNL